MNESSQVIWREWASCEFDDHEYLSYLYGTVADERAGTIGSLVLGVALAIGAMLALAPVVVVTNVLRAVDYEADAGWVAGQSATAVCGFALLAGAAGFYFGAVSRWRLVFRVLVTLPFALAHYIVLIPPFNLFYIILCTLVADLTILLAVGAAALWGEQVSDWWFWRGLPMTLAGLPVVVAIMVFFFRGDALAPWSMPVRRVCFWWQSRPTRDALERAVADRDRNGSAIAQILSANITSDNIDRCAGALADQDWKRRWVARHACVRLAGLAVGTLADRLRTVAHDSGQAKILRSLLSSIGLDTKARFAHSVGLCATCLMRVTQQKYLSWDFFGCRNCRGVLATVLGEGQVVAVLDSRDAENSTITRWGPDLRLNWFAHAGGSDFDAVEIVAATDQQVERLVMSMANETDPFRRKLHARATCRVWTTCVLGTNTMRLLSKTFRRLETTAERDSATPTPCACH